MRETKTRPHTHTDLNYTKHRSSEHNHMFYIVGHMRISNFSIPQISHNNFQPAISRFHSSYVFVCDTAFTARSHMAYMNICKLQNPPIVMVTHFWCNTHLVVSSIRLNTPKILCPTFCILTSQNKFHRIRKFLPRSVALMFSNYLR